MFKTILFCLLCLPLSVVAVQVDEEKFNHSIDLHLQSIEHVVELIWNIHDESTYYYLLGQYAAFEESKKIFQECVE